MQKGGSRHIALYDEDPVIIEQMLKACYAGDYDDSMDSVDDRVMFNTQMYVAADKYMISFLKDLAKTRLTIQLDQIQGGTDEISRLAGLIRVIYGTTVDQTLRCILFPTLRRLRHDLRKNPEFLALLTSGLADGNFAIDTFTALADLADPRYYFCKDCFPGCGMRIVCDHCQKKLGYEGELPLEE
jgi:cellulose synthase/poly-beta-1,6-N-acetylglucosamine synthase-like glycosyltransferase